MNKKLFNISFMFLILGLVLGVFYREFTKFNGFTEYSTLSVLHVHTLVLGFFFFLIVMLLNNAFNLEKAKKFSTWIYVYIVSLVGVISTFAWRGILQVRGTDFAGLPHIAGVFHFMLGVSLIWFMIIAKNQVSQKNESKNSQVTK